MGPFLKYLTWLFFILFKPSPPIHRLSFEEKEYDHFTRAIQLSCISQKRRRRVYRVTTLEELKEKLSSQNIPSNWVSWQPNDGEFHIISLCKINHHISVQSSLTIYSSLTVTAFRGEEPISLSLPVINDVRQIELLIAEIDSKSIINSPATYHECF